MTIPKYLGWLLLVPMGFILIGIQFHIPDPVGDSLNDLLSNNSTSMNYAGIKPLIAVTLFLWEVSGLISLISGIVLPLIGYARSQRS